VGQWYDSLRDANAMEKLCGTVHLHPRPLDQDGYLDLTVKFHKQSIVAALEAAAPFVDGEERILTITGETFDGLAFENYDCVRIIDKRKGVETRFGEMQSSAKGVVISEIALGGGHPNPFRSETEISFSLPEESQVSLTIYHVSGKQIRTLVDNVVPAGHHFVSWDGRDDAGADVATGIYFCRMSADGLEVSAKLIRIE